MIFAQFGTPEMDWLLVGRHARFNCDARIGSGRCRRIVHGPKLNVNRDRLRIGRGCTARLRIGCGSVTTYCARAVIERGGLATKVNFMWDAIREVRASKVNFMWESKGHVDVCN